MNTLAHSVALSAIASIDQRRSVLIDSTDTDIVAQRLMMLNMISIWIGQSGALRGLNGPH